MKITQNKKQFKGFTLVELIIVITILAILATIAFISFQGYTKNARDGNRLSVVNNLGKGLDIYKVQTGKYPQPEGQILTGTINNQELTYKGEIQDTLSRLLKLNKTPKDPVTQNNFVYGVTQDLKEYQISSILEGDITYKSILTPTYADSYYSKVEGNYKGYLRYSSGSSEEWLANMPSLLYNYSGSITSTGVDLLNLTGTYYIINNGVNLPYAPVGIEKNNKKLSEIIKDKTKNNNAKIITIKKTDINKFIEDGTIPSYLGATSSGELIGSFGKSTTEELKQYITGTSSNSQVQGPSCGTQPSYTNATFTIGTPTIPNQSWQSSSNTSPCYWTCGVGKTLVGNDCVTLNYFSGAGTSGDPYRLNGVAGNTTTTIATSCNYYNLNATTNNSGNSRGAGTCGNGSQECLTSGVYLIDPDGNGGNNAFQTYCDMNSFGGGWTWIASQGSSPNNTNAGFGTIQTDPNSLTNFRFSRTTLGNLVSNQANYEVYFQWPGSTRVLLSKWDHLIDFTKDRDRVPFWWNGNSRSVGPQNYSDTNFINGTYLGPQSALAYGYSNTVCISKANISDATLNNNICNFHFHMGWCQNSCGGSSTQNVFMYVR